ncbi:helix-turn-helix domain-containing protein [Sporichthya polymorpha]|uniref:helix-turn-helix domain-containing protein n=1 Tax=Sporichthya polymorpha TaxID=35751 RepID=UPI0003802777|nr:helix-turn-helix transcriptional regulator [Sporichthya polymorpha]
MAKNKLRAARENRGWSQTRLMRELTRAAGEVGVTLPADDTMRTAISRWENGHRVPEEFYRQLFRAAFGLTDFDLGFAPMALPSLGPPVEEWPSVQPDALAQFETILAGYTALDHLAGHRPLLVAVTDQAGFLEARARWASGVQREGLLRLVGRYAEFAGWLHQEAGDHDAAMAWTDRALDAAHEIDDLRAMAYVLHRKSNIATQAGRPGRGIGLAEAALRRPAELPGTLRAVALRQRANALALLGERQDCERALGQALEAASGSVGEGLGDPAGYCTPAYVQSEAGGCWIVLRAPARAIAQLESALTQWPADQERDRGLCLSRLALAHAVGGDLDTGVAVGLDATNVVRQAPSARSIDQLRQVRALLAGSRTVRGAQKFEAGLADLTGEGAA